MKLLSNAQFLPITIARSEAVFLLYDIWGVPIALLRPHFEDSLSPIAHRNVPNIAIDVLFAGVTLESDVQVFANPVPDKSHVPFGLKVAQFDDIPLQSLVDDRARDVPEVLAWAVVVEHPLRHARDIVRVVEVHLDEVRRQLRGRVNTLRVDRGALAKEDAAVLLELVVTAQLLSDVSVLLVRPRRVELRDVQVELDDRLQEVQRPRDVRLDRIVGPVPGLTDVGLAPRLMTMASSCPQRLRRASATGVLSRRSPR